MRALPLLRSLGAFLHEAVKTVPMPDPAMEGADTLGSVKVFYGNVPDTNESDMPERFPFVVIRWMSGEGDEEGQNMDTVALILGVYAPEGPGEAELVTAMLMDHLRGELMRNRLLDNMFDLQLPIAAAKPDPEKKQHNYHIATITTRWGFRTPRRPLPFEGEIDE